MRIVFNKRSDGRGYTVDAIDGRTVQPDGTVVPFTGKPYEKVIDQGNGYKTAYKVFSMPAVQVGSILEYRYKLRWEDNVYSPAGVADPDGPVPAQGPFFMEADRQGAAADRPRRQGVRNVDTGVGCGAAEGPGSGQDAAAEWPGTAGSQRDERSAVWAGGVHAAIPVGGVPRVFLLLAVPHAAGVLEDGGLGTGAAT